VLHRLATELDRAAAELGTSLLDRPVEPPQRSRWARRSRPPTVASRRSWAGRRSVQHNFFAPGDSVAQRGGTDDLEPTDDGAQ
jgi:hypothetical protein